MTELTRSLLETWDADDPLGPHRQDYALPEGVIYLDGNSLGPLPHKTKTRLRTVVEEEWGRGLIRSWNDADWMKAPGRVGDKIAKLIGADAGEVIVSDSTSINLYKLVGSLVGTSGTRKKIITENGNFPTDQYILQGLEASQSEIEVVALERVEILDALDDDTLALVLTHVHYKTGEIFDMDALTRKAQSHGAYVIWDLCHSAGAMPVHLNDCNVDLAVGCGYKYLNGGPGAPAFSFIAKRHQGRLLQPISGWFGHKDAFAFSPAYEPAPGIDQHLVGTPGILGLSALEVGVDLLLELDMDLVREKSLKLVGLFRDLVHQTCDGHGLSLPHSLPADQCGSQIAVCHDSGYRIMRALIDRGVIGDFREPNVMRIGFGAPYIRYTDVWDAAQTLRSVLETEAWKDPAYDIRLSVT